VITKEDVVLAYRLMLGRDPESDDVINNVCQNTHSTQALRDLFIKSPEFVQRMGEIMGTPQAVRHRHPFHLPKIPVETEVSNDVLDQMFQRIHKEWDHLGNTEPYWSVVTQPQYYQAEFEAHREQFYTSGNHSCKLFLAALRRCGVNPSELHTCLDIGCGVGRVTAYLAAAFSLVIATDISASHIALAKQHMDAEGIGNVSYQQLATLDQLGQLPQVDAIFTLITLQHNPPPIMAWMLRTLLNSLRPGGVAYFQLPTYRTGYMFEVERYLHSTPPNTLEMHYLPQNAVFRLLAETGCQCLEVREDGMVGAEDQMLSNTFLVQKCK